ncbi:MAG: 4-alpha-glucanotransferase [Candidatus Endonucleobacter bathymodioli]|uniref:4-alpha-glucanotransferase n=1 Tax=Candidatus Endonucleibacter bathymodioli TaxID=539814 RepID=A0AA90SMU7_9GAMM|nr:4-alpha-glucanotransferase [Candidatus Endonucleobacter bathymodioli]
MPIVSSEKINELAKLCGITTEYLDWAGNIVHIPSERQVPIFEAMGIDVSSEKNIDQAVKKLRDDKWQDVLPPIKVIHQGQEFIVPIYVLANSPKNIIKGEIVLESGQRKALKVELNLLPVLGSKKLNGNDMVKLSMALPEGLPQGYHRLCLKYRKHNTRCLLIVVPSTCYEQETLARGNKIWGTSIQLYTVRSHENWGIGDFSDLKKMVTVLGEKGADIVGLNPIHALYPDNPQHCSPYSPSSRKYINPLYIDVTAVDGFEECEYVRQKLDDQEFHKQLNTARQTAYIDYGLVASLKFDMLEHLFLHFNERHWLTKSVKGKEFDQFRKTCGQCLEQHALYEALFEHFRAQDVNSLGWSCWPESFQKPDTIEVKAFARKHKDRVLYYTWLQWLAECQLEEAQQAALKAGMSVGIYRDLAVGVDREGADVWRDKQYYCLNASVGAPPDGLAPQGQNWGLPPFNPATLYNNSYAPFIEMVRANMQHCGAVRIDHVAGLFRLWWCPTDKTADYGIYVNYSLDDMLGIIKLESHRYKCLIFGEDLGIVPEEVEEKMASSFCYSNEVVLFSCKGSRFMSVGDYKSRAMTCISNHDIPTLKSWWNCNDIDLLESLGIYSAAQASSEKDHRHNNKIALLGTLKYIGETACNINPDDIATMGYTRDLMEKIHYYLAKTASKIAIIQLEDMFELDTPVNVPGTSVEYPNWQRRLPKDFSEMLDMPINQSLLKNISMIRKS